MKMRASSVFLFLLPALVHVVYSVDYSELEAMELACGNRDQCDGYKNNLSYQDRSCECDSACNSYQDCCIDAPRMMSTDGRSAARGGMVCMHYGGMPHAGVYAIARCSSNWNGPPQVREKCEGSEDDFSDPLVAAPVTSIAQGMTYRNRFCAECNNADLSSLTLFQLQMRCEGLQDLSNEQIVADMTYNRTLNMWGVNRLNFIGNETLFYGCDITSNVPSYLSNSVRFCRSDLISSCPQSWTRDYVRKACDEYMAVVYDNLRGYRNPHCAICNGKRVDELSCLTDVINRKRPASITLIFDFVRTDGDEVGLVAVRKCPENQVYDNFFKKCRRLLCALPGYVVANGKCVKG